MRRMLYLVCLAIVLFVPLYGQTLGEIVGEVKDATGALVPNATVTATNAGTNASRTATTNQAGLYTFPSLVPGIYSVKVDASGFRPTTKTNVELQVQSSMRVDFALEVGQVAESIEVSGSAALMTTENATVGTVIENKRIVELPLNGRNFLQLVALSPNVTYGFATPGQVGGRQGGDRGSQNISLMGMRGTWNRYTLDGIENTDVNFNLYVLLPSIDALQEFKVQSGIYPAEFGRAASQINVSTKPGGNEFHGALFEFMRNNKLDAKQYDFIGTNPAKSPFKYNQFGFALGGPVWIPKIFNGKNRLFFMANYEGFRQRTRGISLYTTPTAALRNGDFSSLLASGNQLYDPGTKAFVDGQLTGLPFANNQIPKSRFDPTSVKLLEFWPDPNVPTAALSNNFQIAQPGLTDRDQFTLRMDFNESSNSQWFGRYSWTDESALNQGWALNGTTLITKAKQYMISNTRVLSSNKVNELRFGVNWFYNLIGLELSGVRDVINELNIPGLNTPDPITWGIPRITNLVNYSGFGNDSSGPFAINDAVFQVTDNLSWIKGKHSLRFGGEIRRDRYNQKGNEFARGSFEFNGTYTSNPFTKKGGDSVADLLMGNMNRAEAAIWLAFAQFRSTSAYFYVDDTYRIAPRLTVNMGLRYELTPPWYDRSQNMVSVHTPMIVRAANVQNVPHPVLVRPGKGDFYEGVGFRYPGVPVARDGRLGDNLVQTDYSNWAPRLGIAYTPSAKWTFRTGFGMFYSVESGNSRFDLNRGFAGRVSRNADPNIPNIQFGNFLTGASYPWILPASPYLWSVKYDVRNTYSMMYLFNIQREIDKSTVLEVGYNGSISRHLQGLQDTNAPVPGTVGSQTSRRPFPEFGVVQAVHSEGMGSYSGLGVKLTRRMDAGFTYLFSYTWSKALDDASAIRGTNVDIFPQDSYCLSCENGYSAFNTPHRMVTSILYELPFGKGKPLANYGGVVNQVVGGWQLGSIVTIQSGRPLNMQSGFDISGTYNYGEVRLSATGQDPYAANQSANGWFNAAGFTLPSPGGFGNITRNRLMGPTTTSWDFSTMKNFPIMEGRYLQFRFEAFNFPNHPRLGDPNLSWGSRDPAKPGPSFGLIRGAGTMRQLQFALKLVF